jgi:iron complex transport system ATP-binding protein
MTDAIEIRELSVRFGNRHALGPLSVRVPAGRVLAIAGENGSGKSTLLRAIARLVDWRSGDVLVGGRPAGDFSRRELAREIAYCPQLPELVFPIPVEDLVLQGRAPWRSGWLWENRDDRSAAARAMAACDVLELSRRDATKISGGERRRAFLARMLAQSAPVWLLDEPTADLDPRHRMEFLSLLASAHREHGATVLWATHDLNDALALADDALLLREGRCVAAGPVADCLSPGNLEDAFAVGARVVEDAAGGRRVEFFPRSPR